MSILCCSFSVSNLSSAQLPPTTPLWCIEKRILEIVISFSTLKLLLPFTAHFLPRFQACDHCFTHPKRFKHDSNSF